MNVEVNVNATHDKTPLMTKQHQYSQLKRWIWNWRGVLLAAPSVTGLVLLLRFLGLLQAWEWAAYDFYLRLRPVETVDQRIAIVGIDEADVQTMGQAIFPDQVYADAIAILSRQQPRAIGLDIYRDVPVEPGHQQLLKIFRETPNLVGIEKVIGATTREVVAPPPILKDEGRVAANDVMIDADNTVRRGLVSVQNANGEQAFGLGFYLALMYLDAEGIQYNPIDQDTWQLGQTVFSPLGANEGSYVRADAGGYQLLLNYRHAKFDTVSLTDVLEGRIPDDWGRDRIILIGAVGESLKDSFLTPKSSSLIALPEQMSGVEIHAHVTSQILSAAMEGRPLIRGWSDGAEWLWIAVWSTVGALLAWQFRHPVHQRRQIFVRLGSSAIALLLLLGSAYGALLYGWWIPLVPSLVGFLGSAVMVTAYVAHTAGDIRRTFGRYLSDEVVATLLEHPEGLKLGGERRHLTMLTSDLRGFTGTAERLPPEAVIKILNFYLGHMAAIITDYGGTIDEFMGDGILVLFGAPTQRPDDAERAVACAIAMQNAMHTVNQQMAQWKLPPLEMGIGIHTGEVVLGNIGSEQRTKYGVVGRHVNLTYRIESYTTGGQILISPDTRKAAGDIVHVVDETLVQPKGVAEPITIYLVGGIDGKHQLYLPQAEAVFVALEKPLRVRWVFCANKHIDHTQIQFNGKIVQLSEREALIQVDDLVEGAIAPALTNLKLNLMTGNPQIEADDIYGKVLDKPAPPKQFYLRFTSQSTAVALFLNLYAASQQHGSPER